MSAPDPYPSRFGDEPYVRTRRDPVLHGRREGRRRKGPLSPKRLASYESRGYVGVDSLFEPAQTRRLCAAARRIFAERQDDPSPKVFREPEYDELRSVFEVHEDDETVYELVRHPRVLELVDQILGGPAYIHQSRINFMPAFHGQPFHWHSDFETWHMEDGMPRMGAFSLSISLTENRPDNGPMMVIPESHRYYISCPGRTPELHWKRAMQHQEAGIPPEPVLEAMVEDHGIESTTGPAGSATIFDCNLMHGTNGNITPIPRSNLFLVFNRLDNPLAPPYSGQPPRPQHIANRNPRPLS